MLSSLLDPSASVCYSSFCCWLLEINKLPERKLAKHTVLSWATVSEVELSDNSALRDIWFHTVRSHEDVQEVPGGMPVSWCWLTRDSSHLKSYWLLPLEVQVCEFFVSYWFEIYSVLGYKWRVSLYYPCSPSMSMLCYDISINIVTNLIQASVLGWSPVLYLPLVFL